MSDEMKRELSGLRAEMHKGMDGLHREMGAMRDDMTALRDDLRRDMGDIRSMFRRTMIRVAQMTGDMADVKRDMSTRDDISKVTGSIEGLAGKVDDMRLDWARNHDRLNAHEERLDRLDLRQS